MIRILIGSILVTLVAGTGNIRENGCRHRDYGHGSTVCVCTVEYCDKFPPVEKINDPGVVTAYQTSRSGDRLVRQPPIHFQRNPSKSPVGVNIRVDRRRRFQPIYGFGGAFTDATGANIEKLPEKLQHQVIQDYFGEDGIQYNMGRVPIGGSDFSIRPYSYDDNPSDETLSKFSLQQEDLRWKIPWMKFAEKISPHRRLMWFGSPWAPPVWMKTNNKVNDGGFLRGQPGGKYYRLFAQYLRRFLEEYQRYNVTMWGLTIQNEPLVGINWSYAFNSLIFYPWLEGEFLLVDLKPELEDFGFNDIKIMIFDHNLPQMEPFVDTIMFNEEMAKLVDGFAFHWYQNDQGNRTVLDEMYHRYNDGGRRFILNTEACDIWQPRGAHVSLGNWTTFNRYAGDIITDLNHFVSGWIDWNMALDTEGGPNWVKNFVDAPIIINGTAGEYYRQPMFYAMGHFSKFFSENSVKIFHEIENLKGKNQIDITAFYRTGDNSTVLVVLNQFQESILINVNDVGDNQQSFEYLIPAESLVTFIWWL